MLKQSLRRLGIILGIIVVSTFILISQPLDFLQIKRDGTGPLGLQLGLDLQGGAQLVYQADLEDVTSDQMEGLIQTIERRTNAFGVTEPSIQILGKNRLIIQLPGVEDIEEAKLLIGQTAKLEFKERVCSDATCDTYADKDIGLTGDLLDRAYAGRHAATNKPIVNINFNSEGTKIFAETTKRISGTNDRLAILIDDEEILAPMAEQAILGGTAFIQGPEFTIEKVRTVAIQLESGRLPVPISVIKEEDVDATLGADALEKSLIAGYIGLILVAFYMLAYYRIPGLMASLALISYTLITLAIFKLIPVTLTLAGVAGFILSVGMAVDANVLIFERTKEELRTGRGLANAIEIGFSRAWSSIRDSNVATFITCIILFWFGTRFGASMVAGFAVTLFIGVAVSMFSAIVISQTLLRLCASTPLRKIPNLFTPVPGRSTNSNPKNQTARS
ncbi:MAG: protein translocase subunit SecD [Chloroflexi bacterium]|nr:protein translocase subunit SecD [Chloroflexota bacterium]|tara:strand:- start:9527 stop:10867 length:1341 start_codon:yes stop_codon:yes gene_type:complete